MTTRLYFLVSDETSAKKVADAIRAEDIDDEHIHAVAKRHKYRLGEDIPEAGLPETSDVVNVAEHGGRHMDVDDDWCECAQFRFGGVSRCDRRRADTHAG